MINIKFVALRVKGHPDEINKVYKYLTDHAEGHGAMCDEKQIEKDFSIMFIKRLVPSFAEELGKDLMKKFTVSCGFATLNFEKKHDQTEIHNVRVVAANAINRVEQALKEVSDIYEKHGDILNNPDLNKNIPFKESIDEFAEKFSEWFNDVYPNDEKENKFLKEHVKVIGVNLPPIERDKDGKAIHSGKSEVEEPEEEMEL